MNKMFKIIIFLFYLVLLSCEDQETLPEFGTILVNINFVGSFPDSGEVIMTLNTVFPITGPPAGFVRGINDADLDNGVYTHSFIDLPFRTYERILISYWPEYYEVAGDNYFTIGDYEDIINLSQEEANINIEIDAIFE